LDCIAGVCVVRADDAEIEVRKNPPRRHGEELRAKS
jgi:hypothetical protein